MIELAYFGGLSPHAKSPTQLAAPIGTVKGRIRLGSTPADVDGSATGPAVRICDPGTSRSIGLISIEAQRQRNVAATVPHVV